MTHAEECAGGWSQLVRASHLKLLLCAVWWVCEVGEHNGLAEWSLA